MAIATARRRREGEKEEMTRTAKEGAEECHTPTAPIKLSGSSQLIQSIPFPPTLDEMNRQIQYFAFLYFASEEKTYDDSTARKQCVRNLKVPRVLGTLLEAGDSLQLNEQHH